MGAGPELSALMLRGERKIIYVDWEPDQVSWRRGFEWEAFGEARQRMEWGPGKSLASLWGEQEEGPRGQLFIAGKARQWVLTMALEM